MPSASTASTMGGSRVADQAGAEARDERQPAGLAVRAEPADQGPYAVRRRLRADLDADRVADAGGELDVRTVERPGPLADPEEMRGQVVGLAGARVGPGERLLVRQQQGLVAGVELDGPQLVRVGAAGPHERQRAVDLAGQPLVALTGRALPDEVLVPRVHLMQVGVAASGERAAQVQRDGGAVVGAQHPVRVVHARLRREVESVDGIAPVGRQLDAVPGLRWAVTWAWRTARPACRSSRSGRWRRRSAQRPSEGWSGAWPGRHRPWRQRTSRRSRRPAARRPHRG